MTGTGEPAAVDLAPQSVVLSVIMPVYNGATTLRLSLAPLLRMQRDGEIAEILLVDDGSTDGTRALAAELGVRVIDSGGRLGPGGARNVAVPMARGVAPFGAPREPQTNRGRGRGRDARRAIPTSGIP